MTDRGDPLGTERWKRLRKQVIAESDLCWLCGHYGAREVDHVIPREVAPELTFERSNLAPAHGSNGPCPTCHQRCNQRRTRGGNGHRPAAVPGWTVERCRFAGVRVEAGSFGTGHDGKPRPAISYTHDPDCRQNHSIPW